MQCQSSANEKQKGFNKDFFFPLFLLNIKLEELLNRRLESLWIIFKELFAEATHTQLSKTSENLQKEVNWTL